MSSRIAPSISRPEVDDDPLEGIDPADIIYLTRDAPRPAPAPSIEPVKQKGSPAALAPSISCPEVDDDPLEGIDPADIIYLTRDASRPAPTPSIEPVKQKASPASLAPSISRPEVRSVSPRGHASTLAKGTARARHARLWGRWRSTRSMVQSTP
jgi:hypothetical protein